MTPLRVTIIGAGAIGSTVATALSNGEIEGAELRGVVVRRVETAAEHGLPVVTLDEAVSRGDLIVECAGVEATRTLGVRVIPAGGDLLVTSVGALAYPDVRERLLAGPGRLLLTTGAIGGLDILSAASHDGGLDQVRLRTSKAPTTVVQPWMSDEEREHVLTASGPVDAFSGAVTDAIERFPASLNVAVALAHATGMWDAVTVTMVADPDASLTTHHITASGRSGDYEFTIRNRPHPSNPATSGVVPHAVLAAIARIARPSGTFA